MLTNYKTKFVISQLDHEYISKSKLYYNIYNNKISEPLQKFWFSVPNIKYSNNYSEYKTIRFLMNNKNENISKLINYIKEISALMVEKLCHVFEDISVDYPWKESSQYPYIFSFFTNNDTLFIDTSGNEINYDLLNQNDSTYSIIFEISSIRVMPIKLDTKESHTIKINLVLILIKQDEKKDLKKYLFTQYTNDYNEYQDSNYNSNINQAKTFNSCSRTLPFLNDISCEFSLNKTSTNINSVSANEKNQTSSKLIIDANSILKAISSLKKVDVKKEHVENINLNDDNDSQINVEYMEKKNSLKKVKTKEKSLLKNLQKKDEKKKKKKKEKKIIDVDNDIDNELNNKIKNTL